MGRWCYGSVGSSFTLNNNNNKKEWTRLFHVVRLAATFLSFPLLLSLAVCPSAQWARLGAGLSADSSVFHSGGLLFAPSSFLSRFGVCKYWVGTWEEDSQAWAVQEDQEQIFWRATWLQSWYCPTDACLEWEEFSNLLGKLLFHSKMRDSTVQWLRRNLSCWFQSLTFAIKLSFTFCSTANFQWIFSSRLANSSTWVGSPWFKCCLTADLALGSLTSPFLPLPR